jgi:hypothetical protein
VGNLLLALEGPLIMACDLDRQNNSDILVQLAMGGFRVEKLIGISIFIVCMHVSAKMNAQRMAILVRNYIRWPSLIY